MLTAVTRQSLFAAVRQVGATLCPNARQAAVRSFVKPSQAVQGAAKGATKGKGKAPNKHKAVSFSKGGAKGKQGKVAPQRDTGGSSGGKADTDLFAKKTDFAKLPPMHPEAMNTDAVHGIYAFPNHTAQMMQAFGVPKNVDKEMRLQAQACSLIRPVSIETFDMLQSTAEQGAGSSSRGGRQLLVSGPGSGKSMLMLQAASYARENNWLVLYVPRMIDWINSSSSYAYSAAHKAFLQPSATTSLLFNFAKVNADVLGQLRVPEDFTLPAAREGIDQDVKVSAGMKLSDLCKLGLGEDARAQGPRGYDVLEKVMQIVSEQTEHPTLIAIDDAQVLFDTSDYLDPQYKRVEAYHLAFPRLMLSYLTGSRTLARGAVISALSASTSQNMPSTSLLAALALAPDTQAYATAPKRLDILATAPELRIPTDPYTKLAPLHYENACALFRSVTREDSAGEAEKIHPTMVRDLGRSPLSQREAAGLLEGWVATGMLHSGVSDEHFIAKFLESGGNPRAFERGLRRSML